MSLMSRGSPIPHHLHRTSVSGGLDTGTTIFDICNKSGDPLEDSSHRAERGGCKST